MPSKNAKRVVGRFSTRNPYTWVLFFTKKKILKHASNFLTEPKFLGFRMAKTLKIVKFVENGLIFQEISVTMGTLSAKMTLKDG